MNGMPAVLIGLALLVVVLITIRLEGVTGRGLRPILRIALLASISCKLEFNLWRQESYNDAPPGLTISLTLLVSLLLAGLQFLEGQKGEAEGWALPPLFAGLAVAILVWCGVSVLGSGNQWVGFTALWGYGVTLLACTVAAREFRTRRSLRQLLLTLAGAIAVNSVVAMLQAGWGLFTDWTFLGVASEGASHSIAEGEIARTGGFLGNPNYFAWYLVTFLPLLLAVLLLDGGRFDKWMSLLLWGVAGLGVAALINTYSRGSWLAFIVAALVVALLALSVADPERRKRAALRLGVLLVLLVALCAPFAESIYVRLTEDDRGSVEVRIPLMQVARAMISDNPWLGVGLANYEAEMRRYDETEELVTEYFDWPVHNIFLHAAAESGIPALLSFLGLVLLAMVSAARVLRSTDRLRQAMAVGVIAGMVAFLWTGMKELGSFGSSPFRLIFLIFAISLSLGRRSTSR